MDKYRIWLALPCVVPVSYTHLDVYKRQGEGLIVIGSIPMILGSIGSIIMGIIVLVAIQVLFRLSGDALVFATGFLAFGGLRVSTVTSGWISIGYGLLCLVLFIMTFRRRNNPLKSTFCIVVGIISALSSIASLILTAVNLPGVSKLPYMNSVPVVMSICVLVGGILNSQQKVAYRAAMQQAPVSYTHLYSLFCQAPSVA